MDYFESTSSLIVSDSKELLQAVEEVKRLRLSGAIQPVRIRMRGGVYCLEETLLLDNTCTGTTFEPFDDSRVVISGGKQITGFRKDTYFGTECFSTFIPEVKEGLLDFTDFYVDEKRADFTRFPTEGFLRPQKWENPDESLNAPSTWFSGDPEKLKDAVIDEHTILSFNHLWVDEHASITDFDRETGTISFSPKSGYRIGDTIFCLENVPQTLRKPNQWYLEHETGKVYYVPADPSQTPENIRAFAPVVHTLVRISGKCGEDPAYGIRFRNVTLAYTTGTRTACDVATDPQAAATSAGAYETQNAKCCSLEDTKVTCYGRYGAFISEGCHDIRISGCEFSEGGAGGIRVCGAPVTEDPIRYTSHVTVTETIITRCGRRYAAGVGVLVMHASSCEISHCEIHDLYYSGISVGWTWGYAQNNTAFTRIIGNHIWDIGQAMLSDMGGVYLLGRQEGTLVSGNLIHDVQAREYGGWALYTDEGSALITMENNVCYRVFDLVYHQHYGTMNTIRNNIFAFGGVGVTRVSRPENHLSIVFENCILYSEDRPVFAASKEHFENGRVAFRDCVLWDEKGEPRSGVYAGKLDYSKYFSMEECTERKVFIDCVKADPHFADPHHGDFSLPADSPVYATGFRPIDISDAGVRRNIYKSR